MNGPSNENIIDLVEKTLTKEELTNDYVDIKQASQILNNVSTKTAKKYIDEVSESHGIKVEVVAVTSNGGVKKLYKKETIITIARILNKDKTVLVHVPPSVSEEVFQDNASSNSGSNTPSNSLPTSSNTFQESSNTENNQKLAVAESIRSIGELRTSFKEFATNLRELNDNVRSANTTMQNVVGKIVEQGIDLKEKYLEDRIKRTEIERQQAETSRQQAETLKLLLEKSNGKNSINSQTLLIVFLVLVIAVGGGWFFISTSQQRIEKQFEEKLDQEKQIQTAQYEGTIKQLKETLNAMIVPIQNAAVPPAGQGK